MLGVEAGRLGAAEGVHLVLKTAAFLQVSGLNRYADVLVVELKRELEEMIAPQAPDLSRMECRRCV